MKKISILILCLVGGLLLTATSASAAVFSRTLVFGDTGTDVLAMQQILVQDGYFSVTPTGYFGSYTVTAVKQFQRANGILATGDVDSLTANALNQVPVSTTIGTSSSTVQQEILLIEQEIQALTTEISQINNSGSSGSGPVLSQSSLNLVSGQTTSDIITSGNGSYYISSNTNPAVASVSVSGNQIQAVGLETGSTTVLVCQNNTGGCTTLYLSVNGSGYYSGYPVGCTSFSGYSIVTGLPCSNSITGAPVLGQTSLYVGIGQSSTDVITSGNGNYYISLNSQPNIASVSVSGNQIIVTGEESGNSSVSVCSQSSNQCTTLYIYVNSNGSGNGSQPILQEASLNLNIGTTASDAITSGNGSYYLSSNSEPNVASASLNGDVITATGINYGSTSISICENNGGVCTTLYVSVNGSNSSFQPVLAQSNLGVNIGATVTDIITSGNGGYYISSNSEPYIASVSISGSQITISGIQTGSTNVSICESGGGCATLYVSVNGYGSGSGSQPILQQSSLNLTVGEATTDIITSGSGSYYIASNSQPNIASATINGSEVMVSGIQNGSTSVSVCESNGGCATLYLSVSGLGYYGSVPVLSQTNIYLSSGQSTQVSISGGGNYYVGSVSNPNIASVVINGIEANVSAVGDGSTNVSICQSGGSCATLYVSVQN